ncbi:penicillin-binding protein 2 [Caulobacter sp. 17J65-9]|uniref:peptidoglycan D,D-transpeptidase FtsI family protein n=1 Tax=Caulobacter sp. 17J65-9 TaxID=2709382 RepID=UPI0013C9CE97|nr:penicillin-binding protein 2 [Caulobacter sp. 17J65-9]NEX92553.1 penicillin-binding protein 2 [Caulobacter sp. 17J65-9]
MRPLDARNHAQIPSLQWLTDTVWSVEHAFERAKAEARPEEDTRVRIFFVLALFACAFFGLSIGATKAALFSGARAGAGAWAANASTRADVVDRNGRLLATDLVHYQLYVDPNEVWDEADTRQKIVKALPEVSYARLQKALTGERRVFVMGGLTPRDRARVHDLGLPGVSFEEEDRRVHPLGRSASHLIGFSDTGGRGLAGVERSFDQAIRDAGRQGGSVPLSIDLRVQGALENELRAAAIAQNANGAVGIVTNVHTGEILGMASWPDYDPNVPGGASDNERLNRAAASVYEMGSTFKVFTVAMGLDTGAASLTSTFDAGAPMKIGSRSIHDSHAENRVMTLEEVFMHSSNIGTSKLALTMGGDTMVRYFDSLGLLAPAPVELIESARPIVPRKWDQNTVASTSFGHAISVSPLALTAAMGAIGNGGEYVPLTLKKLKPDEQPQGRQVVSGATSRAMLDLMRLNVVRGTGTHANAPGLRVGGKTGSAEKVIGGRYERSRLVSSFAAFFPTDGALEDDRYFVLILLDEPKGNAETYGLRTGGWTAAPVAGRVIDRIAPLLGVDRRADPWTTATGDKLPISEIESGAGQ